MNCRQLYDKYNGTNLEERNVVWFNTGAIKKEAHWFYSDDSSNEIELSVASESDDMITFDVENVEWILRKEDKSLTIGDNSPIVASLWDNSRQEAWFDVNGTKRKIIAKDERVVIDNYGTKQKSVRDSLIQRLSLIKGELWYRSNYGLPMLDKVRNKGIMDAVVIETITSHPDINKLLSYSSTIENHRYSFTFVADTIYTNEKVSFSLIF